MDAQLKDLRRLMFGATVGLALLLGLTTVHAQTLRITAANASNSAVYDVIFSGSGGSIAPVNSDASQFVSFRSVVYVPNQVTGKVDALVADASRGVIVRYADITRYSNASPPPPEASTLVWSTASSAGPAYPDGMSVDSYGNLLVVSSDPGGSKQAQFWGLPAPAPGGSNFGAPRLIDASFNNTFEQLLEETLVASTANGATGTGDVLLLANSPTPAVFAYSAADIQNFLSCNPTQSICPSSVNARTLIQSQFPAGAAPSGMDFWPSDNSLLIADSGGTILRYSFPNGVPTPMSAFASGLGNGKYKLKTGLQTGVPYAFVANNNGGDILEFGAPPPPPSINPPLATVTTGVEHPQGLAVSNLNDALASACQQPGGCDILGGVITHAITGSAALTTQYVIEAPCIVEVDPRWSNPTGNNWVYTPGPLPVSQVCAGYGGTEIPAYLSGGSGASGHGFALVKSVNTVDGSLKGALVVSQALANTPLPNAGNPPCPQTVVGWAPLESEGSLLWPDPLSPATRPMLDMTTFCDASGAHTSGLSIFGIGLTLNVSALPQTPNANPYVNFGSTKYQALINALNNALTTGIINKSAFQSTLLNCINTVSYSDFIAGKYSKAASDLLTCDSLVANNESSFSATAASPNPSGEFRGRIGNLYLTIEYWILGNAPPSQWPPTSKKH